MSPPQFAQLAARFALPWPAYVRLLSVKLPAARAFYESEALRQGWSVRQLDRQIGSQLYERLALSRNKVALLDKTGKSRPEDALTPEEAIRDPFVLEFLDLKDEYSESDLEQALIQHLADFLLEPESGSPWTGEGVGIAKVVSGGATRNLRCGDGRTAHPCAE
ncbi:YhcG family protein [Burkholderia sp. b14]|uniref:YhcG family protein n=1 Tax=Burkholderia sp. b14 TaxID=1761775 RepID=UPI0026B6606B